MLDLSPIDIPKAADVLADVLREQILEGQLGEGSTLPSERDLAEQSGLTRVAISRIEVGARLLLIVRTDREGA